MLKIKGGVLNKVPVLYTEITHENVAKLKRIQYAALALKQKTCYFPAYSPILSYCMKDIDAIFKTYKIDDNGKQIIRNYKDFMKLYKAKTLRKDFKFVLRCYQHQLRSLLDIIYNFRWNLSLDPGLGKTKIIIDYLRYLRKTALIVAPASLLPNWIDEFDTHSFGELKVTIFADTVRPKKEQIYDEEGNEVRDAKGKLVKKAIPIKRLKTTWLKNLETDVLLISYGSAAEYEKELQAEFDYDIIVLDESHRIKNYKGTNSKSLRKLSQKAYRRVTMSGTYILNNPLDAWPQMDFLAPQIINAPFYTFRSNYCVFDTNFSKQVVGFKNLDKANLLINKFSTRFTKEDAIDMPKRTVIPLKFDLSSEQMKWYTDVLSEDDLIFNDGNISKDHKVTLLGKLAQICRGYVNLSNKDPKICDNCPWVGDCIENNIKPYTKKCNVVQKAPAPTVRRLQTNPALDLVRDLLDDLLGDPKNKVLIWCRGTTELDMLEEYFNESKIGYVRITEAKSTITKVKNFNENPEVKILLSNIATGIGYTANSGQYSVYFSVGFSLEHYLQSRDRNYRLNTKHPVWEYQIMARDTLDEPTFEALKFKKEIADTLTTKINCSICPQKKKCSDEGITIFGRGCKFKKKVSRKSIKV